MRKLLVPTDFSKNANMAIDYAMMLAAQMDDEVEIIILNAFYLQEDLTGDIRQQYGDIGRVELLDTLIADRELKMPKQVSMRGEIHQGVVAKIIVEKAEGEHVDFIIMGKSGAGRIKDWILGSTCRKVVKNTEKPIIAIPAAYNEVEKPNRIGFGVDDELVPNDNTIKPITDLVDWFDAELELLHVEQQAAHSDIHKLIATKIVRQGYQLTLSKIESVNVEEALRQLAQRENIDLLCMIRHDFSSAWDSLMHDSTTNKIVSKIKVPFMILHDVL